MSAAAGPVDDWRGDGRPAVRWLVSLALVSGLHAAVVAPLLRRAEPVEPPAPPLEAIAIDLPPGADGASA